MASSVSLEAVIKKTVERSFPAMGDPMAFYRPSHFSEMNVAVSDSEYVDRQATGDGRNYFIIGSSKWGGDDVVAE